MNHPFDFTLEYRDHTLRVTGSISPAESERGPSYSSGGEPGCPACVEDLEIRLQQEYHSGPPHFRLFTRERLLADPKGKLAEELEAAIFEHETPEPDYDPPDPADDL